MSGQRFAAARSKARSYGSGSVERGGVGIPDLDQAVLQRLERELVVAERLLRVLAVGGGVVAPARIDVLEQVGVVGGQEVELPLDQLRVRLATEDHRSSP